MRPNLQETTDLVTFTGEILNGKLHILCNGICSEQFCLRFYPNNASVAFLPFTLQLLYFNFFPVNPGICWSLGFFFSFHN